MLVTQEEGLKDFWYPVLPLSHLKEGPVPFTLLGKKIAVWVDGKGQPAAVEDRCCHRSALLSKGWVENGNLTCPYHGWAYAANGACVTLPQQAGKAIPKTVCVKSYHAQEKYGYVWVCLGEAKREIPDFPEAQDPAYRFFPCFYEVWDTSSLRVVENELDMAHFAVVHRGTFGDPATPNPVSETIEEIDPYTVSVSAVLSVRPPVQQQKNTGEPKILSTRKMDVVWHLPFMIRLGLTYPSGLHHVIINYPTPIDDSHIQVVQFCFRNDTEAQVSEAEVLKFERLILNEDRSVLETTEPEVPLVPEEPMHLVTDKPALLVRKRLAQALHAFPATSNYKHKGLLGESVQ